MSTVEAIISYHIVIHPSHHGNYASLFVHEMVSKTDLMTGDVRFEVREVKSPGRSAVYSESEDPDDPYDDTRDIQYSLVDVWKAYDDERRRLKDSFGDIAREFEFFRGKPNNSSVRTKEDARTSLNFETVTSYIFRCTSKRMTKGKIELVKFKTPVKFEKRPKLCMLLTFLSEGGEDNAIIWRDTPRDPFWGTGTYAYQDTLGNDNIIALARDFKNEIRRQYLETQRALDNRGNDSFDQMNGVSAA
jgi:hypothetical protein